MNLNRTLGIVAAVVIIALLVVGIVLVTQNNSSSSSTPSTSTSLSTSTSSSTSSASPSTSSSSSTSSSPSSSSSSSSSTGSGSSSTSSSGSSTSSSSSSSSSESSSSTSTSTSSSTTTALNDYYFLVFTQKGIAELTSPSGNVVGYIRIFNISDSTPAQAFYWVSYPAQGAPQTNFLIPLNNGTIIVVNSSMAIINRLGVGTATGFIGVAISPNEQYAAIADGPSGFVEVIQLNTLKTVWSTFFKTPSGATSFPCDIRWSPDGSSIVIPMKNNGTIVAISTATGNIISTATLPIASDPFMLSINSQGNMLAVELTGNKTDVFYSYPELKALGHTSFTPSTFSPTRGVFTPDGAYYLEASGSTNVIEVISTTSFTVVNTINLPASGSPGFADMEITPDGANVYAVMHGTPSTGGIIYLLSLSTVTTATGASGSIPLTTAPAFSIPISAAYGTYLADQVLSPPVTGLHC